MIMIMAVILVATTILPGQVGQRLVFRSVWFNALLVLLILNTAFCFFSRIHLRGWTLVSAGLIIFHLSFVAIFVGVIIDSLFYYRGVLRFTEGESISFSDPNAYDEEYWGRYFDHGWMRGDVAYRRHLADYKVGNKNKGTAFEISVMDGERQAAGVIYPARHLSFNGFRFYQDTAGFSPLFILYDKQGKELYGAYTSLQNYKQKDGSYIFTTGVKNGEQASAEFPQIPNMPPLFKIQFTYHPPTRPDGQKKASYKVWEYDKNMKNGEGKFLYAGSAQLGEKVAFGDYALAMKDVRHWASINVLYNPGLPLILASLWAGLGGLVMTAVARLRKKM